MINHIDAVSLHEAAFRVIAAVLNVPLRPTTLPDGETLRRCAADIFARSLTKIAMNETDDETLAAYDNMALIMFAGHCALLRYDPTATGDRDHSEGCDLLFCALLARFGSSAKAYVGTIPIRATELTAEAARLVADNWPAIEAEAARLAAKRA
jgi:hypothetical protein